MEAASGKDLKWFFDQWVHKAGHPELKVRWHYEDADKTVRVKVEQTQTVDEQTPLFRLPTTLEITEDVGKTRVIPIVIDAALHEFVIPCAAKPRMVQIDPRRLADQGARLREAVRTRTSSSSSMPACVLGRLAAARALAGTAKDKPEVAQGPRRGLEARKSGPGPPRDRRAPGYRRRVVRAALLEAAGNPEAKIRVAAIEGLAKLKHDDATEALFRAAWANPKEAYGAARPPCEDSSAGRSRTPISCSTTPSRSPPIVTRSPRRRSSSCWKRPVPRPASWPPFTVDTASLEPCAPTAVGAFGRLAKDDSSLQDILITLVGDPDRIRAISGLGRGARAEAEKGSPRAQGTTRAGGHRIQRLWPANARGDARGIERRPSPRPPPPVPAQGPERSTTSRNRPPISKRRPRSSERRSRHSR